MNDISWKEVPRYCINPPNFIEFKFKKCPSLMTYNSKSKNILPKFFRLILKIYGQALTVLFLDTLRYQSLTLAEYGIPIILYNY